MLEVEMIAELESELCDREYAGQVVGKSTYRGPVTVAEVYKDIARMTRELARLKEQLRFRGAELSRLGLVGPATLNGDVLPRMVEKPRFAGLFCHRGAEIRTRDL